MAKKKELRGVAGRRELRRVKADVLHFVRHAQQALGSPEGPRESDLRPICRVCRHTELDNKFYSGSTALEGLAFGETIGQEIPFACARP